MVATELQNFFWIELHKWFQTNRRKFPWRETTTPYNIFVAEFLLQQTHVRKVETVYRNLIRQFPTVYELARADYSSLHSTISPLGLSYRADRLQKCAQIIVNDYNGLIPDIYEKLISLPGVGPYIANAVLCYAYNKKVVPVDTNVIRLFTRFFGFSYSKSRARTDVELAKKIEMTYLDSLLYRDSNLAVLDFSGSVCTFHRPKCEDCPLSKKCSFIKEPPAPIAEQGGE
jgi:A/G-specific adenine glycosylase